MFRRPTSPLVARSVHRTSRSLGLVAGATLALSGLAACGGSSGGVAATVPADAALVVKAVGTISWDAKTYEATATNGTVKIAVENDSSLAHNFYILDADKKANPVHLDIAAQGDIESAEFNLAPGTYSVVCRVPGHGAMNSTLTVK